MANEAIRQQMTSLGVNLTRKEELWSTSAAVVRSTGAGLNGVRPVIVVSS
jgi:hypothetical protein